MASRLLLSAFALTFLSACASHDARDRYVLGEATKQNIAEQSVRDVELPNTRKVESTSGQRAAKAVKALNEGKPVELRDASASSGSTQ